jgi:hypothetical protein
MLKLWCNEFIIFAMNQTMGQDQKKEGVSLNDLTPFLFKESYDSGRAWY